MSKGIECYCIDDTKRPNEIPQNLWVVKGEKYTITHVYKHLQQNSIQGVELAEFDISHCLPYGAYRMSRFAIKEFDLPEFMKMLRDCTDLNEIEIDGFLREILENKELILVDNDEKWI